MGKDYKANVGLDVSGWKTGVQVIKRDNRVLDSGFRAVSAGLDNWKKSAEGLAAKHSTLTSKIENQNKIVSLMEEEYKKIKEQYGETSQAAQNFAVKLNNEKTALGKSEKALRQVNDLLDEYEENADGAGDETKGLKKAIETLKNIEVFKFIAGGIKAVGKAAINAGKKLLGMASDTAATGDEIDKMSQKMGFSRQAFQEWKYIAEQNGATIDSLQGGLATFTEKIDDAKSGAGEAAELFGRLNVDPSQFATTEAAFEAVVSKLQEMEDGAEKSALASKLLGSAGEELMPMLNGTAADVENLKNQAHDLGLILSDEAVDSAVAYSDSLNTMKGTFSAWKDSAISTILPGLTMITDGMTGMLAGTAGAGESIQAGAQSIINNIVSFIPQITSIVSSIAVALLQVAPDIIKALVEGIMIALPELMATINEIFPLVVDTLVMAIPMLIGVITEALPMIVESILAALPMIIQALLGAIPQLIQMVVQIITTICGKLGEIIPQIVVAVIAAIPAIITALIGAIPQLIQAGVQLFISLVENLPYIIAEIIKAIPLIIDALVTAFSDSSGTIMEIGTNLLKGIWEGIKNSVQWIKDKISGLVSNIVGIFNDGFDINSPSKETEWVGEMVGQGVGVGIMKSMKFVLDQAKKMKDETLDSLSFANDKLQLSPAMAGGVSYDYSSTFRQDVTYQAISRDNDAANVEDLKNKLKKGFKR